MDKFVYKAYKNLNVTSFDNNAFMLTSKTFGSGNEKFPFIYVARNKNHSSANNETAFGSGIKYFNKDVILSLDVNSSIDAHMTLTNSDYLGSIPWGENKKYTANFLVWSEFSFSYFNEYGKDKDGFSIHYDDKGLIISKYNYNAPCRGGILVDKSGKISFVKITNSSSYSEITNTKYKTSFTLPKIQKIRKPNLNINENSKIIPFELTKTIDGVLGHNGAILLTNYDKGELYKTNPNSNFDLEGYAIEDRDDNATKIGYYIKKGSVGKFFGPVISSIYDTEFNYFIHYYDNSELNGYNFYQNGKFNEAYITHYNNGKKGDFFIDIYEYQSVSLSKRDNNKNVKEFIINYHDMSLTIGATKEKIPNPYNMSIEEEFEEETKEETIEDNQDLEEQILEDLKKSIGQLDDVLSSEEIVDNALKNASEEVAVSEETNQPVKPKEKDKSIFDIIYASFMSLIGYICFPFKWIFGKAKDLLSWIKNKFRRKKRYKRRYSSFSIVDLLEDIWDKIKSFFAIIFGFLGSIFKIIGKGILVGLSAILTGILFIPKVILKGLGAIGEGVKEASFATIVSFAAPLLSGIFLLLISFNCILPMNDWFSNLVSKDIFSWMGLHLCTLFLNAVGVNFFSVIGVIVIFFVDAFYNILLIIFELIMCLIYLIVFFVGVYGVGVVVLVLIILSYVFVAKSKGAAIGVTLSMVASIIMLVFYYIALVALWNSVG